MKNELHPGLGPQIIRDLRSYCDLPTEGIVAGGAVADWFLHREPADVDVFASATDDDFDVAVNGIPTAQYVLPTVVRDTYTDRLFLYNKDSYRVVTTSRQGMLNRVACSGDYLSVPALLSGFDLNSTQVGIDLASGMLYWTRDFDFFLKTRQLQVSTMYTPAHTAIRYFNKKRQLDCYGNNDLEMEILAAGFQQQDDGEHRSPYCPRLRFGQKFAEMYRLHQTSLLPYFDLEKLQFFWTLAARSQIGADFEAIRGRSMACHRMLLARILREERLCPYRHTVANLGRVSQSPSREAGAPFDCAETLGRWYVRGQVTERAISEVSAAIHQHHGLGAVFFGMPLSEQLIAKRMLVAKAKLLGPWVWGVVETEGCALDLASEDNLDALLLRYEALYNGYLTTPLPKLPRKVLGLTVRELLTRKALLDEGAAMRHCVGGYGRKIYNGQSRIISLSHPRLPGLRSTLELMLVKKSGKSRWQLAQHSARRNEYPPNRCRIAAVWIESILLAEGNPWIASYLMMMRHQRRLARTLFSAAHRYIWRQWWLYAVRKKLHALDDSDIPF